MKVGVIGGGAAGLAAAFELVRQGHEAHVFERASFLGGQASTFNVGGSRLEKGYHHLFTSDVDMAWIIRELDLESKLAWIPSKVGLFHKGEGDDGQNACRAQIAARRRGEVQGLLH